jgi:hypothetical protein
MTRKSLIYAYHPVPDQLPASKHQTGFIDSLDTAIEGLWTPEIKELMQPIGHPQSKRFFIQQYKAMLLIKVGAKAKGMFSIANSDDWKLMSALRRVAHRRGIAPMQLLVTAQKAAE